MAGEAIKVWEPYAKMMWAGQFNQYNSLYQPLF